MGNWNILQFFLPLALAEADKDKVFPYQDGTFYQHTVCGQQLQLCLLAHGGQLVLQTQFPVLNAGGIKKFFEWKAAGLPPGPQLRCGGIFLFYVLQGVGNPTFI